MTEYDIVGQIVTLLSDNWNAGNVTKPKIQDVADSGKERHIDISRSDKVLIYETSYDEEWADIGKHLHKVEGLYSIDMRTMRGRTRQKDLFQEVKRIVFANTYNPFNGTVHIAPVRRQDLSNRRAGTFILVYDIRLTHPTKATS